MVQSVKIKVVIHEAVEEEPGRKCRRFPAARNKGNCEWEVSKS